MFFTARAIFRTAAHCDAAFEQARFHFARRLRQIEARPYVKRALRLCRVEAWNGAGQPVHERRAGFVNLVEFADAVLRAAQRGNAGTLHEIADRPVDRAVNAIEIIDQIGRCHQIAEAPAGHRIRFRKRSKQNQTIKMLVIFEHRHMHLTRLHQLAVSLIGGQKKIFLGAQVEQCSDVRLLIDDARRIVRIVEHDEACARRDCATHRLDIELVIGFVQDRHRHRAQLARDVRIERVTRIEDNDFVTRIENTAHHRINAGARTIGDQHLARRDRRTGFGRDRFANRFQQRHHAFFEDVTGVAFVDGFFHGFNDMRRRGERRTARIKPDQTGGRLCRHKFGALAARGINHVFGNVTHAALLLHDGALRPRANHL